MAELSDSNKSSKICNGLLFHIDLLKTSATFYGQGHENNMFKDCIIMMDTSHLMTFFWKGEDLWTE